MDSEVMSFYTINLNSFSDAPALQIILEQPLEKKSGVRYGPPGARRLVYFVDDMNMPFVDKYDTQSAVELLRQVRAGLGIEVWMQGAKHNRYWVSGLVTWLALPVFNLENSLSAVMACRCL